MKISCVPWLSKLRTIITLALLLPVLALGLQGCSTLRLAYSNAPTAAYWYLDGYLDFNDEQRPAVRTALKQLHQWHQQTQLPAYLQTLDKLQAQMASDITTEQACALYGQVQTHLIGTGEGMAELLQMPTMQSTGTGAALATSTKTDSLANAGMAATVLATLDARQLEHLERKFSKSNAEYRKDYLDGPSASQRERREARRLERTMSRAETLYGPLDQRQQDLLAERLQQAGFQPELAYKERLRRQQDLLQTLRAINTVPAGQQDALRKDASLKDVLARVAVSPDSSWRAHSQALRQRSCDIMAALHNSTNAKQRQHAAGILQSYARDLQASQKS